ncbi:MAG: DUF4476 domain-containing protein [Taibaiella sp.]|jgi:hypothetical protein
MKRILVLVLTLLLSIPAIYAQKSNRSTMRIRLSDGSPMLVTINGRDFKKIGRSITIGDIPRKRQYMQVYKYRAYADGKGGKAELVYSGNIKIQKGYTYDCIVDLGTRKFRMKEVASLQPLPQLPAFDRNRSRTLEESNEMQSGETTNDDVVMDLPPDHTVSTRLQPLKNAMDRVEADSKKLAEAKKFINSNSVSSEEVKSIAGWIFFDDNRLLFVKAAYPKVSDKNNFATVGEVFTLEESQKAFDDFLKSN